MHHHDHDFNRGQSHQIFPLIRNLKDLNVSGPRAFLLELTEDISDAHDMGAFSKRVADLPTGKLAVPTAGAEAEQARPAACRISRAGLLMWW